MLKFFFIFLLFFNPILLYSQSKPNIVIDGGRLLLDVFNEIKSSKNTEVGTLKTSTNNKFTSQSFCLYNPTENRITIELTETDKNNIVKQICNSTIPPKDSTCCLNMKSGNYHIKVVQSNTTPPLILKEADFYYDAELSKSIVIK